MSIVNKLITSVFPKFLDFLYYPILGRPLIEWAKRIFIYSFILWIPIAVFNIYQHYKSYTKLEQQEAKISKELKRKEKILARYKSKINDLNIAYKEVSKYFTPQRVKELMKKIDMKITEIENRKKSSFKNLINPYRVEKFNVDRKFNIPFYINEISLKGTEISADSVEYFKLTMLTFYKKWKKYIQQQKNIRVSAQVVYNNGLITLFLRKNQEGILNLQPKYLEGVVCNMNKIPYIPTSTGIDSSLLFKDLFKSQYFFGWDINLKEGGF